ncbi:YT521-B-like domain-containing protein [Flammula alnicola]|nr:YT521-B-like domain-containing protein [Flammula alnicola]
MRRSYHPNPPAHRSEWVMWSGNVPSDATHDELWRFFAQQPQQMDDEGNSSGVLSIFLISRSNCAFINYESEDQLLRAIVRFNGIPLRPNDSRCPRLVCRVRRKDDDLKAGVGGQRGMGMHTKWVQEQKGKAREAASDPSELKRSSNVKHSSSSGSYSSTNSSFLGRHFPKRYFILKSLTQEDLDISVQRGVWATQKHNEEILDKAFRTSKEVHLIFGVNKSGEFYGYARGEETWGDSFAVQWLCTDPLPFHRTRHLRNPWNHDKEVKVSRDGTELEPTVGQQLLSEWEKLSEPQGPPSTGPSRPGGAGKREKEGHHDHDKTHDSGSSHHQEKILTPLQNHQRA